MRPRLQRRVLPAQGSAAWGPDCFERRGTAREQGGQPRLPGWTRKDSCALRCGVWPRARARASAITSQTHRLHAVAALALPNIAERARLSWFACVANVATVQQSFAPLRPPTTPAPLPELAPVTADLCPLPPTAWARTAACHLASLADRTLLALLAGGHARLALCKGRGQHADQRRWLDCAARSGF